MRSEQPPAIQLAAGTVKTFRTLKMRPPHRRYYSTVKPLVKDTPKEDKPPNKGQAESTLVYTLYRKSPMNLSTKDKTAVSFTKRFHCSSEMRLAG